MDKLAPLQEDDFYNIYKVMAGKSVTIRLLDPPLHEFLPKEEADILKLSEDMHISPTEIKDTINELEEVNPMLGHRGCRLAITFPEIYRMQTRAIMNAALRLKEENIEVAPEIMIPLVGDVKELMYVKREIEEEIQEVFSQKNNRVDYHIGTMIEIPRAALKADEIAQNVDFFSFGTNDLTQMTFGFSRDDAGKFLPEYINKKIYAKEPFASLDQEGVGQLVALAVEKGRKENPDIHLGVCGEHGGDPSSIEFFNRVGLDYVSCSPFRVPIARVACAQAEIKNRK